MKIGDSSTNELIRSAMNGPRRYRNSLRSQIREGSIENLTHSSELRKITTLFHEKLSK